MRAIIIGNGDIKDENLIDDYLKDENKIIICCDGGIKHAFAKGIMPDFILGDFDSANDVFMEFFKKQNITIITFPCKKDKTDMEIGIDFAIEKGANEILIFGGMGTRFDHTLANVHILKTAVEKNISAWLINENNKISIIKDEMTIEGKKGDLVSLIPLTSQVTGVTTIALEYKLNNAVLNIGSSWGISNVMKNNKAIVKVKEGLMIIIKTHD